MMRTPHSSSPRSAANIRFSGASRLRTSDRALLVAREQREQLERNDRRAAEEKFDHRGVRESVARNALDILHLLLQRLAGEALERRIRDDGPDIAIDREEPRRAGAGHAGGNAAH